MLRFGIVFAFLFFVTDLDFIVSYVREPYCTALASSLAVVFSLVGMEAAQAGPTVLLGFGRGLEVIPDCDGLVMLWPFLAGAVAMPILWTRAALAWTLGAIVLLVGINWLRLAMILVFSSYRPETSEFVHHYVGQGMTIVATVLVFFQWLRLAGEPAPAAIGLETQP